MAEDIIVPVALFATVPLTVWAVTAYRARRHAETVRLLDTMASKGDAITPELVRTLGIPQRSSHGDLRIGLILLAIALGLLIFAGIINDDEGTAVISALSAFPGLIGAVYIGLWTFISRKKTL